MASTSVARGRPGGLRAPASRQIVFASAGSARLAAAVRLAMLTLVGLFLAHEAVYVAHFGTGHEFEAAMAVGGHTVYWPTFTLVGLGAAAVLTGAAVVRLRALGSAARSPRRPARLATGASSGPSYGSELVRLWAALWLVVLPLYLGLENVETLLVTGSLPGFDPIVGHDMRLAVPVVALLTLALAALGALVRWRIAVLRERIARAAATPRPRVSDHQPSREWHIVGALAPHRWTLTRPDAGRAPPLALAPA